jgi:hypothetical protein
MYPFTKSLFVLLPVLMLSACQSGSAITSRGGPWYSDIPVGSRLVLQRPVTIRAEGVSVGLRHTGPRAGGGQYPVNCKLELYDLNPDVVVVEPDSFVVTKVSGGFTSILAAGSGRPVMLAGARGFMPGLARGGDGSSYLKSYAQIYIKSDRQPNVYRIDCSTMGDPWEVELLKLSDIREALRGVFVVELATP